MVSILEREPHQFSHRQLIVLTFPLIFRDFSDSLIPFSLAVAHWAPRKHPQSLSSLDMRRSRRRTPDRVFRISAKAHALAMQGRQPPMGGQSLIIQGLALESSSYPVSSGYLFSGVIGFPTFLCRNPLSRHLLVLKTAFAIILTARPFWRYHLDSAPHFHGLKIPIAVCRVMGFLCSTAHHCSVNWFVQLFVMGFLCSTAHHCSVNWFVQLFALVTKIPCTCHDTWRGWIHQEAPSI